MRTSHLHDLYQEPLSLLLQQNAIRLNQDFNCPKRIKLFRTDMHMGCAQKDDKLDAFGGALKMVQSEFSDVKISVNSLRMDLDSLFEYLHSLQES
ncbi:unnamed protein product [Pieris brassicae]|uniref:Uncharacterized protein n=1 Tax=Pieris brassicae TaxID=7116 RepID=A0A9P0XJJ3_PIEBR|nr:unnamed protein product [Pieris brassicae]